MHVPNTGCAVRSLIIKTSVLAALLAASGCASLDASHELRITAETAQRAAGSIDPATAWELPVEGESPAWDGIEPLTYNDAVAVALQGDPTLRKMLAQIVERRAWYVQEGLPPNPTVAFGIGIAIDGLSGAPLMVQGLQMLSWLWKNPHRVAAAKAELRAAVYDTAYMCVDIMTRTRIQVAAVLAAQEVLVFDTQYARITEKTVNLVKAQMDAGELAQLDLDRTTVDHEQALASVVASQHALLEAKLELLGTMGRPTSSTEWIAMGVLPPDWEIPSEESELLALAEIGRLDVAAAFEAIRQVEADLGLAETKRFPEIGVMVEFQRSFSDRKAIKPGASITIPILDNGEPAVAIQNARLEQAWMELLTASETAQREVRTSLNRYLDSHRRTEIIQYGQLASAIAAQERSDAAYAEGAADLNTLLLTQRQRIAVERQLVRQKFETMQAMCSLRHAVGGSFDPELDVVPDIEIQARPNTSTQEPTS
jgi:outer membrane protein TolC